ncbi:MAG: hypothetical protein U1D30_25915 [Planctomycetota bacterium]
MTQSMTILLRRAILALALGVTVAGCGGQGASTTAGPNVLTTEAGDGPVRMTVRVEPAKPRLSDEITLTLTLDSEEGVTVEKPPFGSELGEFVIRDLREPLAKTRDGREVREQIFTLEPTKAGTLRLDPIRVVYKDTRKNGDQKEHDVVSKSLTVEVSSEMGTKTPSLTDLAPAAAPVAVHAPISPWTWALLAVGTLACVAIIILGRRWRNAVRERKAAPLSPRMLAELELRKLLESGLLEKDLKLFYVELTGIVRRYIERTEGIHAPEQTTEEFLREIGEHPSYIQGRRERLKNFLESADLVKFAGYKPHLPAVEESIRRARVFVDLEQEVVLVHEPVKNGFHPETTNRIPMLHEEPSK